ncbi:glycerol-3-phosphate dehydrogenase (nad(+)) [Nannochloropsis oceanica]
MVLNPAKGQSPLHKVSIVGSGNFGSAVARLLGRNVLQHPKHFETDIRMWVFEEELPDGRKLSEVINAEHENVKYLPGVRLPSNVRAIPDLEVAVRDASIIIMVVPQQHCATLLPRLRSCIRQGAVAVSLIKGLDFDDNGPVLITDLIRKGLGGDVEVCVLMGANVADEVARDEFCEATVGCRDTTGAGILVQRLFDCPRFRVEVAPDPMGVELCGALKNVVALGAGFCDGLGWGGNTKAAVIRRGLLEMRRLCKLLDPHVRDATFFESCGVADLITTCYGGRNRKCAERFARADGNMSWDDIEKEQLGGQHLQGTKTAANLHSLLERKRVVGDFPLFSTVYQIAFRGRHPRTLVNDL